MLGKPMRAAVGGGKAVIGSNVKVAAAGALVDVPLGHKDDSWSFPHFDTITVSVADAPRPDEILVVMAIADGGRLRNRCGTIGLNREASLRPRMVAPGFLENPESSSMAERHRTGLDDARFRQFQCSSLRISSIAAFSSDAR
jgi:Amino acid synthesis